MNGWNLADRLRSSRGSAIILVTLLLMVMSALGVAIGVSGRTELFIARNAVSLTQARAAAEAGLNHGGDVVIPYLQEAQANGFATPSLAINALLQADGSLAGLDDGPPAPPARVILPGGNGSYEVRVFDDDDAARGVNLSATDLARIAEDGDPLNDENSAVVIRAIGYAPDNTSLVLESTITNATMNMPAVIVGGNLTISGNPRLIGASAGVHANSNLTVSGNPTIEGDATAGDGYVESGSPTILGSTGGGRPTVPIPPVNAADYLQEADFILTNAGQMVDAATGTVLCTSNGTTACNSWRFQGDGWLISSNSASDGTYYLEGNARITGNPGTRNNPVAMTIIAEGWIDITGNPDLIPHTPELMFVTNADLHIAGLTEMPLNVEGAVLVREQIHISGNPTIAGQIIVEDAANLSNLVTTNQISGNPTISYNGTLGGGAVFFTMSSWREVR